MAYFYTHENLNYSIQSGASHNVHLSELDIFSPMAVQDQIESTCYEKVYPVTGTLDHSSPEVIFNIPPSTMLTSLCDSFMTAKVCLKKRNAAGTEWIAPPDADHVNLVNNTLYSLFKDQMISINGHPVQSSYQCFHYQTYFLLLFGLSSDSLNKWEASGRLLRTK